MKLINRLSKMVSKTQLPILPLSDIPTLKFSAKINIAAEQVFLLTPLSFCIVNLKPVFPGHVLVIPREKDNMT